MMDYAYTDQVPCVEQGASVPLDGVTRIADEVSECCNRIERFIARFHGTPQGEKTNVQPVPAGHIGQLSRAHDAATRLAKLTDELVAIG